MTSTRDTYVARQPILDKQHRIIGYELLFRSAACSERASINDEDDATVQVMADTFAAVGGEIVPGGTLAFINVTPEFIMDGVLEVVLNQQVVLEIPPMDNVQPEFERHFRELAREGVAFALQDLGRRDAREGLLAVAKYAKINCNEGKASELKQLVRRVKRTNTRVIAERVESLRDLRACQQLGCDYLQGYYFSRPVTIKGKRVDPDRIVLMDLLTKLGQGCDFDELVEIFKRNASLSVNLLRLVNSGNLARATKIKTVPEAIVLIGSRQLVRWITLLLYAGKDDSGMEDALMKTAAKRGRVLESLYKELPGAGDTSPETAFLVGMLSLMDVLFGVSMGEVLEQVVVDEEVSECLLQRTGSLGALLCIEEKIEGSSFAEVEALLAELGLSAESLARAQHEAFVWVHANEPPEMS